MIDRLRDIVLLASEDAQAAEDAKDAEDAEAADAASLPSLRLMAAHLLVAAAVGVTASRVRARPPRRAGGIVGTAESAEERAASPVAVWAPVLIGPLAAAAQLVHLNRPSATTRTAMRVLNAAVLSLGAAELLDNALGTARNGELISNAPLVFGSAGLLGMLLDREEARLDARQAWLRRRAEVAERLISRRGARLDRVVVHV